jgi:hypothetical protein
MGSRRRRWLTSRLLERGVLDVIEALPGSAAADQLGLVEAEDRLRQGVVEQSPLDPTDVTAPCSPRRSV